jgi:hypothetical protein
VEQIRELPMIQRVASQSASDSLRLFVDHASTALPAIVSWCQNHHIQVTSIEPYVAPFDDVFFELVKKESH